MRDPAVIDALEALERSALARQRPARIALPIVFVSALLLGCSPAAAPTASPAASMAASVEPSMDADAAAVIAAACVETTYENCAESMQDALAFFEAGSLVAVCEYDGGQGDVVLLDSEEEAEGACSGGGLIAPSRVATVVQLP